MTAAVDARDVFRIHRTAEGDAAALQGLTLRIDTEEVVAVLGPSTATTSRSSIRSVRPWSAAASPSAVRWMRKTSRASTAAVIASSVRRAPPPARARPGRRR